jgi:tellurite methyltransferase
MAISDLKYWNIYYSKSKINKASNFAKFIKKKLINKNIKVLDVGTGDGRDSFYFQKFSRIVYGIDQSKIAINKNNLISKKLNIKKIFFKNLPVNQITKMNNKKFDLIYARFFLHSLNEKKENLLLKNLYKMSNNPFIALEFRTIHDDLFKKGKKISKYERYTDHYRRFINVKELELKIKELGFAILYKNEGLNFSKTVKENPHLCRIIFKKI